jgi:hypothetical protein
MPDSDDNTACPAFERLAIAYHEAAHAVVDFAVWPPIPVIRVSIIATEDYGGIVDVGERPETWRSGLDDDVAEALEAEADTLAHLAGYAAGEAFLGTSETLPLPPPSTYDHHNANDSALHTWDGVDGQWLRPSDYLRRLHEILERPDVRLAVICLAGALLRRLTLTGAEVEAIVREYGVTSERPELPLGLPDPDDDEDGEGFSWSRW